ncbi:hypothetical protein CK203_055837 [Vitis vinifera]|uniref:Reverse transcriptase RNase H-like domain-containing protein n=1 Tax=Vitis vinifera TaxID=29760 RepID=A0A438H634_VITVI|nr:hypothetical protein CK203_055837 [Vitis vinifera]
MFKVRAIEMVEHVQLVPALRLLTDVTHDDDVFKGVISPIVDISGLDPSIVQHRLTFLPYARPIKQKLRRLHPHLSLQVKKEIQKQLSVGFLLVVEYPEWLANVVLIPKNDNNVRVCVDFRDLNKDSTKDDFLFPHINMLVDSTISHSMLSFMDRSYISRAVTTLFHDMMHQDVKVYVDIMLVKSQGRVDHLAALGGFLERIRYSLGCMLAQLDDVGNERAIYYLSKKMLDYEMRYVMIERFCLALVWATQRLRHKYHLASLLVSDGRAIDDDFLDEDIAIVTSLLGWRMYFDGMANHSGYKIVWGIDIIGKISLKSSSGHEFILVTIDYFTKWVESSRVSLYSLVYGMETVLPVEIEIGSLRVALEQQISKAK